MASVILPATEWTDGCSDVAAALGSDDELIVVADHGDDPAVAATPGSDVAATVRTVVAGDPVECAGKANALAAGMERAGHDVVVWTDDDVARDPGWRDRLVEHARESGAATEVPVYVGDGYWSVLEPAMVATGVLGFVYGGQVWGGGVAFDRTELDEEELLADLRRTVGDDNLLSTRIEEPWVDRDHPREVPVGGSPGAVYHRVARFSKGAFYFEPASTTALVAFLGLFAVVCLLFPVAGFVLATGVGVAAYRAVGLERPSVVLSFPSALLIPVALVVGLLAPSFEWGGRRYRWRGRFDVTVSDGPGPGEQPRGPHDEREA